MFGAGLSLRNASATPPFSVIVNCITKAKWASRHRKHYCWSFQQNSSESNDGFSTFGLTFATAAIVHDSFCEKAANRSQRNDSLKTSTWPKAELVKYFNPLLNCNNFSRSTALDDRKRVYVCMCVCTNSNVVSQISRTSFLLRSSYFFGVFHPLDWACALFHRLRNRKL